MDLKSEIPNGRIMGLGDAPPDRLAGPDATAVDSAAGKYVGSFVEVHYNNQGGAYRDTGRLVELGPHWVELEKEGTQEAFLIPVTAIRLMKVLTASTRTENRLLRPAEEPPHVIESSVVTKQQTT